MTDNDREPVDPYDRGGALRPGVVQVPVERLGSHVVTPDGTLIPIRPTDDLTLAEAQRLLDAEYAENLRDPFREFPRRSPGDTR